MDKKFELYASGINDRGVTLIFQNSDGSARFFSRTNLTTEDNYENTMSLQELISGKHFGYSNHQPKLKELTFWIRRFTKCKCCKNYYLGRKIKIHLRQVIDIYDKNKLSGDREITIL